MGVANKGAPFSRLTRLLQGAGDTEVEYFNMSLLGDHDIVWSKVAMAEALLVSMRENFAQAVHDQHSHFQGTLFIALDDLS